MEDTSQRGRERSQMQEVSFSDFEVFCERAPEGTPKHESDEGELHATSATEKGSAKVKGNGIHSAEWSPVTNSESWINLGSNEACHVHEEQAREIEVPLLRCKGLEGSKTDCRETHGNVGRTWDIALWVLHFSHDVFFFFFFWIPFMCASRYRTPCSTSCMYRITAL